MAYAKLCDYINGEKVTGTFTIDNELITQDNLITQIQAALATKLTPKGSANLETVSLSFTLDTSYMGNVMIALNAYTEDKGIYWEWIGLDSGNTNYNVDNIIVNGTIFVLYYPDTDSFEEAYISLWDNDYIMDECFCYDGILSDGFGRFTFYTAPDFPLDITVYPYYS